MIKKMQATIWNIGHAHRDSQKTRLKLSGWERLNKSHVREYDEQVNGDDDSTQYPDAVVKLFNAAMKRCPSVCMDADVMEGQPCIRGTRIPVRSVLRAIEQYGSVEDVKVCYPHLTIEQAQDALYFSQIILELPSGVNETTVTP